MHVHGAAHPQLAWPVAMQSTQQTDAARKAAIEVRRKLAAIAAGSGEAQSQADSEPSSDRRRESPPDDEAFRNVFVSVHA